MIKRAPIIIWIVVALLGATWWFFGMNPLMEKREQYTQEVQTLTAKQQNLQIELQKLQGYKEREMETRSMLTSLAKYIPEDPNQPALFKAIQTIGDTAGVSVKSVGFSPPTPVVNAPPTPFPNRVLGHLDVTMSVEGGYFQLVDFMRRLETEMGRANLVRNVSLSKGAEIGGTTTMVLSLSGSVYSYVPDLSQPAPAPEPTSTPAPSGDTSE